MDQRLAEWFADGDTGMSSEAIALWLSAKTSGRRRGASVPADPSDLGRCMRLLEAIPEWRTRMPEMAEAGGRWPAFAAHWDELEVSFKQEGNGTSKPDYGTNMPRTYLMMRRLYEGTLK